MSVLPNRSLGRREFIALMACLVAMEALAIDSMLPALGYMSADLMVVDNNSRQLIITSLFIGVALGVMGYGIAADSLGRKRPIYLGLMLYAVGTLVCAMSSNLTMMLLGRVIQGIGAAGPYVISTALIRDIYKGRQMAEVMSLILMVFILIPAIAPLLGQAVLFFFSWRAIFLLLAAFAAITLVWFTLRQPETLPIEKRVPLSWSKSWQGIKEVLQSRKVRSFLIADGCIFGALVGFLSTSQQVFQEYYQLGEMFPVYFAAMVAFLGIAAFFNSRFVNQLGMYRLVSWALVGMVLVSAVALFYQLIIDEAVVPLFLFMAYMMLIYFFLGLVFGNLKSMAMEPMGHIAGVASAVSGSLATLIGAVLGGVIGSFYQESLMPIILGFLVLSTLSKWLVDRGEQHLPGNAVDSQVG